MHHIRRLPGHSVIAESAGAHIRAVRETSLPCSQDEFFYHSVLQKHTDKEFNMN